MNVAGSDGTKKFRKSHGENVLRRYGDPLRVGVVAQSDRQKTKPKSLFARLLRKS